MNITKLCPKCRKPAKFHVNGLSKRDGHPLTYRYCNRCKYREYTNPERQKLIRKKPINTSAYSPNGYTSCAVCKLVEECRESVRNLGPVACEPGIGIAEPSGRGRWNMDKHIKRLGWDGLPEPIGD